MLGVALGLGVDVGFGVGCCVFDGAFVSVGDRFGSVVGVGRVAVKAPQDNRKRLNTTKTIFIREKCFFMSDSFLSDVLEPGSQTPL